MVIWLTSTHIQGGEIVFNIFILLRRVAALFVFELLVQ